MCESSSRRGGDTPRIADAVSVRFAAKDVSGGGEKLGLCRKSRVLYRFRAMSKKPSVITFSRFVEKLGYYNLFAQLRRGVKYAAIP